MHQPMKDVHGEDSLCRSSVMKWRKRFLVGRELLEDDARPGHAHHVITSEMIAEVNDLVLDNHRIKVDKIRRLRGISVCPTHTIMYQHLNCAQWDPYQLAAEQRNTRMALSLSNLQHYYEEEYRFLL
ncbi:histone-lysine N-methyltransferase SETMAR [Trichonephila clavata]|uniref:Histone-lysine N-methyltransferase SETMAR n=1 Tax=Trichonephila clavata TaxID=2740835 RepID=A0A8X6L2Z4_TRICU|nr:histone-lysine N-methyltransferase SETMAR [Trichonephila clavata]